MEFAITSRSRPVGITGEDFMRRFLETVSPYVQTLRDSGVVVENWVRVGKNGSLSIWEVKDHLELQKLINANPISSHVDWEVVPLIRLDDVETP
jgi:muconolactone delta-isomerase